jgi:hypothetical protein
MLLFSRKDAKTQREEEEREGEKIQGSSSFPFFFFSLHLSVFA